MTKLVTFNKLNNLHILIASFNEYNIYKNKTKEWNK